MLNRMFRWVSGLVLALAGLGPAWADTAVNTCPAGTFSEFVQQFGESGTLQRSATDSPLHWQRMDLQAQPEPRPVLKTLSVAQVPFPVLPSAANRLQSALILDVDSPGQYLGKATLRKADTDYLVNYYFIKRACWSLVRVDDWSL